jgi:uncharacterized protein (DUF1330 family)
MRCIKLLLFLAMFFSVSGLSVAVANSAIAIVEIDVRQPSEFTKEFFPLAVKVFADAGAVFLVKPSEPVAVDGVSPKRVALLCFDSVEKAKATFASEAYRDARKIGDKYASFRIFILDAPDP